MTNATQLQEDLDLYRQLCQQVEQHKHRLVGGDSFPVKYEDWEAWKQKEAWREKLEVYPAPPPESCEDPDYYQLLVLYEQMFDLWCDIKRDYDQSEDALIMDVIKSFPSLHYVGESLNPWVTFYQILDRDENIDPQAYYAARFVEALHWQGRDGQWSDRTFYVDRAFDVWDRAHKEAFVRWTTMPFFPLYGFYNPSTEPPHV
jgi:hypothetical protein